MAGGMAITEEDVGHIDPVEKKVMDLIGRFNDPDYEHILRGTFQDTDGFAVISAKQRQAATRISCALAELFALKTAVDYLSPRVGRETESVSDDYLKGLPKPITAIRGSCQ